MGIPIEFEAIFNTEVTRGLPNRRAFALIGQDDQAVLTQSLAVHPQAARQDRMISILQDATRSGKTFVCIPKILALCRYKVEGHRVICGATKPTVYKNYLKPLFETVG